MDTTETEKLEATKEIKRGRLPDDTVESLIMSMPANMEWPPAAVVDAAEDEEEEDNIPSAKPLPVTDERFYDELLRRSEQRATRMEQQATRMERIYNHLQQEQARVHTELCAKGYVEMKGDYDENLADTLKYSDELWEKYNDFSGLE